jgi:hypothetical protein
VKTCWWARLDSNQRSLACTATRPQRCSYQRKRRPAGTYYTKRREVTEKGPARYPPVGSRDRILG